MKLLNWLASADACNKEKMEKTEVKRIKRNGPEHVSGAEVESKKINLALTFYDTSSYPIIDMEISNLMVGMIDVTEMCAKMFMPIGYFETVTPLSVSVRDSHIGMLDMPTDRLQTFLCFMSKKFITCNHWAVGLFQFLYKDIYGRGDINKRYVNVANFLGIADVNTCLTINV